jgi:hypothetical protein
VLGGYCHVLTDLPPGYDSVPLYTEVQFDYSVLCNERRHFCALRLNMELTEGLIMVQVSAVISKLSKIAKVTIMILKDFLLKGRLRSIQNG